MQEKMFIVKRSGKKEQFNPIKIKNAVKAAFKSYEETVRNAIMLRGDADTQAAIAGSIAAAYWGVPQDIHDECLERLPDDMFDILERFSEMYDLEL